MKGILSPSALFIVILSLFLLTCDDISEKELNGNKQISSFEELQDQFVNPPIEYSSSPLWVWNDLVTESKIEEQLIQFKEQEIHQVFIHPRPGLITEYLSYDWFKLVKYTVEMGKKLDMKVWLYDENSYPSGFAGGHVPAKLNAAADQVAGLKMHKKSSVSTEDKEKYVVILKKIGKTFANISKGIDSYIGQEGEYFAFAKWYYPKGDGWFGGFSYVDLLAMGITEKFISETMTGYEEFIGEDFGSTVPGIFTDEPNISVGGRDPDVIKFSPVLFSKFSEKYNYQLENYLPCLYLEIGDWKNVRHDYYALLLEMFIERWSKPWYDYTEKHNLKWTGHYWEHGWPDPRQGPDNMAMYAWHQYPGIDMLFNLESIRPTQFGNIRAVKELSSVVNQLDKERALSESYGGAGWELTFEDMKRLGDWEYALGVNFLNQHLSYMTIKGARKRDYPQSFSYHTPWFKYYKYLGKYFNRLSLVMSSGEQVNDILVLEPTSSAWLYATPNHNSMQSNRKIQRIRSGFHNLLKNFEKNQVEYDVGSEQIIKDHGSVNENLFSVGDRDYRLLVIPQDFENFESPTFNLVMEYLKNGGNVISFTEVPEFLDGNISRKVPAEIKRYASQWSKHIVEDSSWIPLLKKESSYSFINPQNWGGDVFHHTRQLTDGSILFLTNFHKLTSAEVSFFTKSKEVLICDLNSGEIYPLQDNSGGEDGIITLNLPPAGSVLLFLSNNELEKYTNVRISESVNEVLNLKTDVTAASSNMLTLDYCDLKLSDQTFRDIYFYKAEEEIFKYYLEEIYGTNYNPWSNAIQYKKNIVSKNNFSGKPGFSAVFPFYIERGFMPDEIDLSIERGQFYEVFINDIEIHPDSLKQFLDKSIRVYSLKELVNSGRNEIKLSLRQMNIHAELEPVYIRGNFSLISTSLGWQICKPSNLGMGSWKDQGWPFYSGEVSYRKTFSNSGITKCSVSLGKWEGTTAVIKVNGEETGIIGWQPYLADISNYIKPGENSVEVVVVGSLKNLLGPHHGDKRRGIVTPGSFIHGPDHQPEGNSYDQLDYGLLEDFSIIVSK